MTSEPNLPLETPPYNLQSLIDDVYTSRNTTPRNSGILVQARCAQALRSEIYVGCSNGELLRFALQVDDPEKPESYTLLSQQRVAANEKPVEEIVLLPSLARALILADHQVHIYTLPSLDPISAIKPLRNVVSLCVDDRHLQRLPLAISPNSAQRPEPVDLCIVKRQNIQIYSLHQGLTYRDEVGLPGVTTARRTGTHMCLADNEFYHIIDLGAMSDLPVVPLSQDPNTSVRPLIEVVNPNEFLVVSWSGTSALGVFLTGAGDPTRGTLEWPSYPDSLTLDYPYIMALLPNKTIEIHSIETQQIVQIVPPPTPGTPGSTAMRIGLVKAMNGYLVPSRQRSEALKKKKIKLLREMPPEVVAES